MYTSLPVDDAGPFSDANTVRGRAVKSVASTRNTDMSFIQIFFISDSFNALILSV
jgi:hypothetical protein